MLTPSLEEFKLLGKKSNLVPVFKEIISDLDTPVSAFKKIDSGNYSFLLESVERGEWIGRYSFLGTQPSMTLEVKGNDFFLKDLKTGNTESGVTDDPLSKLDELMGRFNLAEFEGLPPFLGGAVGFAGYDIIRNYEQIGAEKPDPANLPDLMFMITDSFLVFDHLKHKILVFAIARIDDNEDSYYQASSKIGEMIGRLKSPLKQDGFTEEDKFDGFSSNFSKEEYEKAVEASKEYIFAGDVFQVLPSQRLEARATIPPFEIYRALRVVNPSPYMCYLKFGDIHILGSSPEALIRVQGRRVESHPIAGTVPRGENPSEDDYLGNQLLNDEKEKAEHLMLVDLARNDLGRVCESGTVTVDRFMELERYSHVIHMVSVVSGKLMEGMTSMDALRASFPAGTVTGAPKVRAMQIINELEPIARGPYGGIYGYYSFNGDLDTGITIRTIIIRGEKLFVQAGGGVVADSVPEKEYLESMNKAKGMLKAVELAREEFGNAVSDR